MKAAVIVRYGSPGVVEIQDVPTLAPGPGELLVRVHAATVNRTDCGELLHPTLIRLMTGGGRSRRRTLGMDFAGTVEALGEGARLFQPGDRVFGMCPYRGEGAQAEYLCMAETGPIAAMPANLDFGRSVLLRRRLLCQSGDRPFRSEARPAHSGLRRFRRDRLGRAAARQVARRRRDRGGGRPSPRSGPFARRGPGGRLCHGGVRPARPRL